MKIFLVKGKWKLIFFFNFFFLVFFYEIFDCVVGGGLKGVDKEIKIDLFR